MWRKLIMTTMMCMWLTATYAQPHIPRFDPAQFRQELVEFVVEQAGLTLEEVKKVAPIYEEFIQQKQALFLRMGKFRHFRGNNVKDYESAIFEMDKTAVEMKTLEQNYHRKLLKVLSAKKVFDLIRAERIFNKRYFQMVTHRR